MKTNPYSFLNAVDNERMFYGYDEELRNIVRNVTALEGQRESFCIVGSGRMGKTSLLNGIEQKLKERVLEDKKANNEQILFPIHIDLLTLIPITIKAFFKKLTQNLSECLEKKPARFKVSDQVKGWSEYLINEEISEPFDIFQKVLLNLIEDNIDYQLRIVLLLDNLTRVKPEARSKQDDVRAHIIAILRALHLDYLTANTMAYVITGGYRELEEKTVMDSPLENVLVMQYLHVFGRASTMKLIHEPTGGEIPEEVAEEIYQATGGHPFLIQFIMKRLCEYNDWTSLTIKDVAQVTTRFNGQRLDFNGLWAKLAPIDKKIYRYIYEKKTIGELELRRMILDQHQNNHPHNTNKLNIIGKPEIQDSLRVLSTSGLIRESSFEYYEVAGTWPAHWFLE